MSTYRQKRVTVHEVEIGLTLHDLVESARREFGGIKSMDFCGYELAEDDEDAPNSDPRRSLIKLTFKRNENVEETP